MSRVERISNILVEFKGKQVGGKKSTRVEVDLSLLLQYMEYEDRIKELENDLLCCKASLKTIKDIADDELE